MAAGKTDLIMLVPTGFYSWGVNMTYKVVGGKVKVNFGDIAYSADCPDIKAVKHFVVGGKRFPVSDFTELK